MREGTKHHDKKLLSKLILGVSALGCLCAFTPNHLSARWNPDSKIQKKCSKFPSPKKCNKDKECFWAPINPQCTGSPECTLKYFIDEKKCKQAENEGCYWMVPTAEDLLHKGYCFEKGMASEKQDKP